MPTRLIRDGILTSQRVDQLSDAEEVFYRRLMSHVDDYGVAEAHCGLLRAALYPLRLDRVRDAYIQKWKQRCSETGLIGLYEVTGREYLQVLNFRQQTRSKCKHPLPTAEHLKTFVNGCSQQITDVHLGVCGDVVGDEVVCGARSGRPKDRAELLAYASEIALSVAEVDAFFDHFEANGWKQSGKAPLKDWRAALRTWKRNGERFGKNLPSSGGAAVPAKVTTNQSAQGLYAN